MVIVIKGLIKKMVESFLVGIIFLYVYNFVLGWFNIDMIIPINLATIILIGFFRLPGLIIVMLILFI